MASELLDVYGLSKARGFLPEQPPQDSFSDPYYSPWDKLVAHLSQLIASHTVRQAVEKLPLLTTKNLTSQSDFERGYVVLSFIAHALVWGSREHGNGAELIPPQITEPYFDICDELGMQRVLSYAGLCLWNWRPMPEATKGENGFYNLANLRSVASFMDSRGENAFYHVPVLVEAEGGPLVYTLLHALEQAEAGNTTAVTEALNLTTKTLERMTTHLPKLYTSLGANMFYFKLRPYLAGGKGMEEKGLKRGFVFQRSDGSEVESRLIGGSAAQSSLFQFLDLALGVEHQGPRDGSESVFTVSKPGPDLAGRC
jgi:indoleamine 2,3-dioxygenase